MSDVKEIDRAAVELLTDSKVLPSATTVRFAVLVMTLIASTGSIYGYIGLEAALGAGNQYAACTSGLPLQIGAIGLSPASDLTLLGCTAPYTNTIAVWTLSGIAGVFGATIAAYLLMPWWTVHVTRPWWPRMRPLEPLRDDRRDQRAVAERVRFLISLSGLATSPRIVVDPRYGATASTFGRQGKEYLRLGLGLGRTLRTDPLVFDGIVLHELAHIRNRDNRPTFITYAAWRVFIVTALVPYIVTIIVRETLPDAHELISVVALTALTYLTRNAVLRVRETHADARAGLVNSLAISSALAKFSDIQSHRDRLPAFFLLHPPTKRRLADLNNAKILSRPDSLAMLGAGIALGSVVTNLVFTFWVGALITTPIRGSLLQLVTAASINSSRALLASAFVYGPVLLITLPLLCGFACVTMWRAQLVVLAGARQPSVVWHAVPFALGFMAGWPLSLNYAIAGTWGLFDSSSARDLVDLGLSALTLCVLLCVIFRWAQEAAAVWLPVASGSLRRQWLVATLIAILGAFMPFFLWLLVHDNSTISTVSTYPVVPQMRGWPLVSWTQFTYLPLLALGSAPGCMVLVALPCLFTVAGMIRRPRPTATPWLTGSALTASANAALLLQRPLPSRLKLALLTGVGAAMVGSVLALGYIVALRGAEDVPLSRYGGGLLYEVTIATWILLAVSVVVAVLVARVAPRARLTIGLLTVLVSTALGSPLITVAVFVGACGDQALSCAEQRDNFPVVYGGIGTAAPLQSVIVLVLLLVWSKPTTRFHEGSVKGKTGFATLSRLSGVVITAVMYLALVAAAYYCERYILKL